MSTSNVNKDGTINVTLQFTDDELCGQDLGQLIYLIDKGIDNTGLLQCIASKLTEALNPCKSVVLPDDVGDLFTYYCEP